MKCKIALVLVLMTLVWVVRLLYLEVNGREGLTNFELKQSKIMIEHITDGVESYKRSNGGRLPQSPLQLMEHIKSIDGVIPLTARTRNHISDVAIWSHPELMNIYGLWTIIGNKNEDNYAVILNPNFFGPKNIVVAEVSGVIDIKTFSNEALIDWMDDWRGN